MPEIARFYGFIVKLFFNDLGNSRVQKTKGLRVGELYDATES